MSTPFEALLLDLGLIILSVAIVSGIFRLLKMAPTGAIFMGVALMGTVIVRYIGKIQGHTFSPLILTAILFTCLIVGFIGYGFWLRRSRMAES